MVIILIAVLNVFSIFHKSHVTLQRF